MYKITKKVELAHAVYLFEVLCAKDRAKSIRPDSLLF